MSNFKKVLKTFLLRDFTCDHCQKKFTQTTLYSFAPSAKELRLYAVYCESCKRELTKKTMSKISQPKKKKTPSKTKKITPKALTVSTTKTHSKTNTLAYYNCLIDQVANPVNEKVKITSLAHHCKCNKGKVAAAQQEHKQQLVQQLARNYKNFGVSLGHYLQADIVGCAKELKKTK